MEVPGNPWREAWDNAKPVPARRQKRLFDDTREAEKSLQYLSALRPGESATMLMPTFLHACAARLLEEPFEHVPTASETMAEALSSLSAAARIPCRPEVSHYATGGATDTAGFERRGKLTNEVMAKLSTCEAKISQALSLRR